MEMPKRNDANPYWRRGLNTCKTVSVVVTALLWHVGAIWGGVEKVLMGMGVGWLSQRRRKRGGSNYTIHTP